MSAPASDKRPAFQRLQYAFTAHVRDPDGSPAPAGIEERRMAIYRDLLFHNVEGFLGNNFPVLRRILGKDGWAALVRDYFRAHRAHTPLFPKMPQEFLQYVQQERGTVPGDLPFLTELAHYEWVELALSLDVRELDRSGVDADGDLLAGVPVLSNLAWPLAYRFPVQRISPDYSPDAPPGQATYIIVYRDRNDTVGFLELNDVSARLVNLLQQGGGTSGRSLLLQVAAELRHADPEVVVRGGLEILENMRRRDVILGSRPQGPASE